MVPSRRGADVKRYVAWCTDNEKKAFPVMEEHVFDFLRSGVISGLFTFMALARARFSDTAYAEEVVFDADNAGVIQFVEMRTKSPAIGVSGANWADAWRGALTTAGRSGRKEAPI
eukprot:4005937-Amphidinium_carterae.1